MRTRIVRIGNSRGVRIPKVLLEVSGLTGEVEMTVRDGALVITAAGRPRQGWDDAFRGMAGRGDDELLDREAVERELVAAERDLAAGESSDEEPWEWE